MVLHLEYSLLGGGSGQGEEVTCVWNLRSRIHAEGCWIVGVWALRHLHRVRTQVLVEFSAADVSVCRVP